MFEDVAKPRFIPAINIGCLLDVTTGHYHRGRYGEHILNGGASRLDGIAARPNNFKSAFAMYRNTMIRRACRQAYGITYDSEGTLSPIQRLEAASRQDSYLRSIDWENDNQYFFTDLTAYNGDTFFELFRSKLREKEKNAKAWTYTTPFIDESGNFLPAMYPTVGLIDSFSRLQTSAVEEIYDKNKAGESGANTDAMTNGKAKKQMFNQLPGICSRNACYMAMTAHVKDVINVEAYPTDKRNLSHMKKDTVLEGVSNGFYSLPNNVWQVVQNKPLLNRDKMPEYPWDNKTAVQGDTDLVALTFINLRGKGGMSGFPLTVLATQSDGLLADLTNFHHCKSHDYFGIGGNKQNYYMELCPDVALSRTKVRQKIDESEQLRRAIELTSEILQIFQFHRHIDSHLHCDMATLFNDIKSLGYDWDMLLNTRGYWVFNEEIADHDKPFLSAMDLLKMRVKEYHPFWLKDDKKTIAYPKDLIR